MQREGDGFLFRYEHERHQIVAGSLVLSEDERRGGFDVLSELSCDVRQQVPF